MQLVVGLAINGSGRDAYFQGVTMNADDLVAARARLHNELHDQRSTFPTVKTRSVAQRKIPGSGMRKLTNCSRMMTSNGERSIPLSEGRIFCTGRSSGAFNV